jgi:hypothetical protein
VNTPAPGHTEALALGCRCSPYLNQYGRGVAGGGALADPEWEVRADCRLHGPGSGWTPADSRIAVSEMQVYALTGPAPALPRPAAPPVESEPAPPRKAGRKPSPVGTCPRCGGKAPISAKYGVCQTCVALLGKSRRAAEKKAREQEAAGAAE